MWYDFCDDHIFLELYSWDGITKIYLDHIFGIRDKILDARSRAKNQNSSPLLYKIRKYQHSCKIMDHNGENVIAFEDLVRMSAI